VGPKDTKEKKAEQYKKEESKEKEEGLGQFLPRIGRAT